MLFRLHGHSYHGDARLQTFVVTLMQSVSVPLYHMITRWVLHGELLDPMLEFFVAKNMSEGGGRGGGALRTQFNISADYLWHHYYKLNLPMLPSFISSKLAFKILVVGKSINFMKACMQHGGRDEQTRGGSGGNSKKRVKGGGNRGGEVRGRSSGHGSSGGNLPAITMNEALGGDNSAHSVAETKGEEDQEDNVGDRQVLLQQKQQKVEDMDLDVDADTKKKEHDYDKTHEKEAEEEAEEEEEDYTNSSILLSEEFETSLKGACHSYGDEVALSAQVHAIAEVIETRLLNMVR